MADAPTPTPTPSPTPETTEAHVPGLEGLLQWRLPSLSRTEAVLGGGDGATLFPFEKTARSTDGGDTWTVVDVAHPEGVMPYVEGGVVLPDSRLLTLVAHWSDDRLHRPSDRPHGLMVSAGDDWSRFTPLDARFTPALDPPGTPGWTRIASIGVTPGEPPVIWVTTDDGRRYVSVDGARTFRSVTAS